MVEITEGNYRVYFTTDSIYLQNINFNKILTVEKFTCNISEDNIDLLKKINVYAVMKPHCILGILKIESYNFFVFVKSAILIGKIENAEIFKIKEAELIPITDDTTAANLSQEIKSHVLGIIHLLSLGYYYSFDYDLTNPKNKQRKQNEENSVLIKNKNFILNNISSSNEEQNNNNNNINNLSTAAGNSNINNNNNNKGNAHCGFNSNINNNNNNVNPADFFYSSNKKFFWNFHLYSKFIKNEKLAVDARWITICINGYVGIAENIDISPPANNNNQNQIVNEERDNTIKNSSNPKSNNLLNFYLISRRSVFHAGTRYLTRGIEDDGHVANFVETEQIIKYANHLMSFVQIRGSVPVFWQQTGMTAQTEITRIPELTTPAYLKHIEEIQKDYFPLIFMINLMNFHKPNEQIITQNFENQIKINNLRSCKYVFWDFQSECKNDNYDRIDLLIKNVENVMNIFKFYCEDVQTGEIIKEQTGIIRTNCLDCLDRTNVIQTRFAWKMLEIMLNYLNLNTKHIFGVNYKDFKNIHPLSQFFKNHWADNGDLISIQYAGTASCITTVTKKGKHGIMGMFHHGLVSLTRIYQGNFEDGFKQKCIDIFLNRQVHDNLLEDPSIEEELKKQKHKYTTQEELTVFVGSWNVGGKTMKESSMLFEWLFPLKDMKSPDIYVIGLQEIVSLNAKNIVLSSNSTQVESWRNLIQKNLNEIDNYIILKTADLVGIFQIIFVKESLKENFRNIEALIVRTGLLGTMGNKGSCLMRFNYLDTSVAFACCHLAAGASEVNSRVSEMTEVITKAVPVKSANITQASSNSTYYSGGNSNYSGNRCNKELRFKDHDYQFLFGDLNFRIDLDMNTVLNLIRNGDLVSLAKEDQLNKKKSISFELMEMVEGPLKFEPTYKYVVGTSEYDVKKKRVPSWCDRILFRKSESVKVLDYDKVDYTHSDHKPIYGIYKIKADKADKALRDAVVKEIKENMEKNSALNGSRDIENFMSDDFFNSSKLNNANKNFNKDSVSDVNKTLDLKNLSIDDNKIYPNNDAGNDLNTSSERNDKEHDSNLENSDGKPKKGLFKKVFTYFKK